MTELEKFESLCIPEPNSGCWIWLGAAYKQRKRTLPYGRFGGGLAHRASYRLHIGDPGGGMVCHACDNPSCVNPDHLFLGDAQSNAADKLLKRRQARGGAIRPSKLTEERVRFIKQNLDIPNGQLAKQFGVSVNIIWNVKNGVSWGWVE
jgi:hypothetical protein